MFVKYTVQRGAPVHAAPKITWLRLTLVADTLAVLVNEPNRPNTKPAIAMAAMSVMAMRMTVARIGEIAFLFLPLLIFIA